MTTIDLNNISKRYTEEWILRNIVYRFESNVVYGIEGANGSGKSTLMKMISGYLSVSKGSIVYKIDDLHVERDEIFNHVSMWGPHIELIQQLKIDEMIDYYETFTSFRNGLSKKSFFELANLPVKKSRLIQSLSSGQAQRLGLALAILSESKVLLLDEPGSYLDSSSLEWFYKLLESHQAERIVIISSNEQADLALTTERLNIMDFK